MRSLRQIMENETVSQIPAIPGRVERYSQGRLNDQIPARWKNGAILCVPLTALNRVFHRIPTIKTVCAIFIHSLKF